MKNSHSGTVKDLSCVLFTSQTPLSPETPFFIDLREKEKYWFVVSLTYAFIG